jgi:hypothetical protein
MKTFIKISTVLLLSLIINTQISAQRIGDLNGINYQAVAIDEDGKEIVGMDIKGKPLYEKEIGVKFSILKGNNGAVQYQETHTTLTDQYGLFSLIIGHGTQTGSGAYSDLLSMPWIDADQWLKVEISIRNDGNFKVVSLQQFMSVPYSFYTDDIADDAITTEKILNETILTEDIATGAVDTRTILDETIINEDIATGAIDSRTILDETIINEDIATGAIDTRTILNETILAEDIATGAVTTDEILNETILAEDIATGAVTTDEILNETILAEDIATGAVTTAEILNETILAEDIATGAVTTAEILNETILAEDIATGAVTTDEILDGTIVNADIADNTIDLTAKVTSVLPVENGGTGRSVVNQGDILIGSGAITLDTLAVNDSMMLFSDINGNTELFKLRAGARTFLNIDRVTKTITISAVDQSGGPNTGTAQVSVGNIGALSQQERNFPSAGVQPGDIILATTLEDLRGITLTAYVRQEGQVIVIFFNGTGAVVNLNVVNVQFANFGQP